ncbi:hypothetical protein L13192_11665 [Pyrenophora tritici-repentis]|uniref:Uncharacterized protein n=1 Tax=Pyrenophora tritici-repentis TaxID=45151 RepID=A0A922NGP3_9PLEO|nr:hypothetical protein Ptr86124_005602 [Pyrenophora tritici-repentis]KAI1664481.1 hypothetical protein L13192_11665 [Pyrenophora tritici-repentis]
MIFSNFSLPFLILTESANPTDLITTSLNPPNPFKNPNSNSTPLKYIHRNLFLIIILSTTTISIARNCTGNSLFRRTAISVFSPRGKGQE